MQNKKIKPALIGGCVFGVLATLPYVNAVNVACCALYIGGGVLAAYLYMKEQPALAKAPYGDGAVVGVLAGLFGAVAGTLVGAVLALMGVVEDEVAAALAALDAQGIELPTFVRELIGGGPASASLIGLSLVFNLISYSIFATIGGLVGVAIFHKKGAGGSE